MKGVRCRSCYYYRGEWCKPKSDSPDPDIVRDCQYYRSRTNADCIRQMSDEELADWCYEHQEDCLDCPALRKGCMNSGESCKDAWLNWLKQEAEICETCIYYPPSSLDGKPCCVCDTGDPLTNCWERRNGNAE